MIVDFLTRFGKYLLILGAVILVVVLALMVTQCGGSKQREAGATAQRESNLNQVVKNVEKANDAEKAVRSDPAARDAECLQNARNPADC